MHVKLESVCISCPSKPHQPWNGQGAQRGIGAPCATAIRGKKSDNQANQVKNLVENDACLVFGDSSDDKTIGQEFLRLGFYTPSGFHDLKACEVAKCHEEFTTSQKPEEAES